MVVSVHVVSVTIKTCPSLLLLHFAEDRFISGDQVKPARSEALAQSITSHAFGKTICNHAACVYPSYHVGLVWSDFLSQLSIRSEPDDLAQRSQVDTESLVASFRKRWITNMIIECVTIDYPHVTHEMGSVIFASCTQEHTMCICQDGAESHALFDPG